MVLMLCQPGVENIAGSELEKTDEAMFVIFHLFLSQDI